jgi:hypothetical protein
MTKAAAFRAEFSDWKLIRTRKVVQIVLEVPVELSGEAYEVLGGMPDPSKSVWCAVARLKGGDVSEGRQAEAILGSGVSGRTHETSPAPSPAQPGRAKSPAQVAGYLCKLPPFWKFLREECGRHYAIDEDGAAEAVREICGVEHRSEIIHGTDAALYWHDLRSKFRVWEMAVV